jgi:CheY-like chemotaxis protein
MTRDRGTDGEFASRPKLLAIDDLQTVLTGLKKVAEELGYQVEATQDAETFKKLSSTFEPTLILMDIVMPEQDGLELLRHLGSRKISTPIILISDYDEQLLNTAAKIGSALGLNVRAVQKPIGPSAWRDLLASETLVGVGSKSGTS